MGWPLAGLSIAWRWSKVVDTCAGVKFITTRWYDRVGAPQPAARDGAGDEAHPRHRRLDGAVHVVAVRAVDGEGAAHASTPARWRRQREGERGESGSRSIRVR